MSKRVWWEVHDVRTHNLIADTSRRYRAVAYVKELGDPDLRIVRVEATSDGKEVLRMIGQPQLCENCQ